MIRRVGFFLYGIVAYLAFFVTILYMIGFLGDFLVPKTVDSGEIGPVSLAIGINVLLVALFALQHTIMARPAFKKTWTEVVPKPIERSTFVLVASAILALIFWQWRPIPATIWHFEALPVRAVFYAVFFIGWAVVFYSSFLIDHFDLFGLRQVGSYLVGREYTHPPLKTRSLYKHIRHPLMLGFLIAMWATPTMTVGHLVFAGAFTLYIFMGIAFEERDLKRFLGHGYARYAEETPMLLPIGRRRRKSPEDATPHGGAASDGLPGK
jgi:protein-S-isoprenylcysteine O-methyltransferase Ste14